ncbi:hypothetical protein D3C76_1238040 [compost metagenome]
MVEVGQTTLTHRPLVLAGMGPLTIDGMATDQGLQLINGRAVKPQQALLVLWVRMLQGKLVRQIDDETGVTP